MLRTDIISTVRYIIMGQYTARVQRQFIYNRESLSNLVGRLFYIIGQLIVQIAIIDAFIII